MTAAAITTEPVEHAIYDGRIRLGTTRTKAGTVDAFDAAGKPLGKFTTEAAAVAAILHSTKPSGGGNG